MPALAAGYDMFATSAASTGEKPQSKVWYHDGSYWCVLKGPEGVAIYEKVGGAWVRGAFADAVLSSSGRADVKWDGMHLFVLVYTSSPKVFKFSYDAAARVWELVSGFPVSVPNPSGSETMVLEEDSTGRLWTTAEGGGNVNVYYSTSADQRTWSSAPVVLRSGVNSDDISSVVAFGGDKIGVFWSDQNRDEFGFRVHHDGATPTSWDAVEITDSGSGHADDHVHLAFDSSGRVYAITKDDTDKMRLQRRNLDGSWTVKNDILGGKATRGIVMVAEEDGKIYVLYTRWGVSPNPIQYRMASLSDLVFGSQTTFITSSSSMNNVTGTKQLLPEGNLIAVAENGSKALWNGWGEPPSGQPQPLSAPTDLTASLLASPARVDLAWREPASGAVAGYNIYRQVDGGAFEKLNAALVTVRTFTDPSPAASALCYRATAVAGAAEGPASDAACVDNTPGAPPGPPLGLTATLQQAGAIGSLALPFDEGSGQLAHDLSANGNNARLGAATAADAADPAWVAGVTGSALQFDGTSDYIESADSPSLDMAGGFTVEAWVNHAAPSIGTILNKGVSGERTYRVLLTATNAVEFLWEDAGRVQYKVVTSSNVVPLSSWHHVACVYDAQAAMNRVYVDGILRKSGSARGTPAANSKQLSVGARLSSYWKDFFKGSIDLVRISPGAVYTGSFTPLVAYGGGQAAVQLAWQPPASGAPAGYNIYRQVDGGAFEKLNATLVAVRSFTDPAPPASGSTCYVVKAVDTVLLEGAPSDPACLPAGVALAAGQGTQGAEIATWRGALLGAAPNPFNPETAVSFRLPESRQVFLAVYAASGRRVATLVDAALGAGEHSVRWRGRSDDGSAVASGVYFVVLRAGDIQERHKLVLLK